MTRKSERHNHLAMLEQKLRTVRVRRQSPAKVGDYVAKPDLEVFELDTLLDMVRRELAEIEVSA